jgi:hypothetical protein
VYLKQKKDNKVVNVPIVLEENSNFVLFIIDLDVDDVGDGNDGDDSSSTTSNFVTSSSLVTSTTQNVRVSSNLDFIPPSGYNPSTLPPPPSSSSSSHQHPLSFGDVHERYNILPGGE